MSMPPIGLALFPLDSTTNIRDLLRRNPEIRDEALAGVVEANIVGFTGSIKVKTKVHPFAMGDKQARVFYIRPFGDINNFFVSLKRYFVGVKFDALANSGADHITKYALGVLQPETAVYLQAQKETREALAQGRRIVIAMASDISDLSISLEQDQGCVLI